MRKQTTSAPLIIEPHPEAYDGYKFITLIRYNDENYINIVDNLVSKTIHTYVLDYCAPTGTDEEILLTVAKDWYDSGRYNKYPLSIEFSRLNLSSIANKVMRAFPVDFVTRVIGPLPEYTMGGITKTRKRKKKSLPKGIEFVDKRRSVNKVQ